MSTMTTNTTSVKPATVTQQEPDYVREVAERAVAAGTRALLERWQAAEPDFEDWAEYAQWSSGNATLVSHLYAIAAGCSRTFAGQVMAAAFRALADAISLTGSTDPATILDRLDALEGRASRDDVREPQCPPAFPDADLGDWSF